MQSTTTVPSGLLYLIALKRRLIRTCFSRVLSARTKLGVSKRGKCMPMPRSCACGSIMAWHSSMTSFSETGSRDSVSLPASIRARSRISLINSSRYHPALRIWSRLRFCDGVGGGVPDSMTCAKPSTALSGVRSSWLMLDRKSDLARLAFSATDLALSSSVFFSCSTRSRRLRSVMSRAAANTPFSLPVAIVEGGRIVGHQRFPCRPWRAR